MSLTNPQQLANINSLRSYIDSTHNLGIRQKADLVKDLNRKKEQLIASVHNALSACLDSESAMYSRWIGTSNKAAHDHLEEFNTYLKEEHERGSELISQINAINNFEQLNKYEISTVDPYLQNLKTKCNAYTQKVISEQRVAVPLIQTSPRVVQTVPVSYAPYNLPVRAAPVVVPVTPSASPRPVRVTPVVPFSTQPIRVAPVVRAGPVKVTPVNVPFQPGPVDVRPSPMMSQTGSVQVGQPRDVVLQNKAGERRVVRAAPVKPTKRGVHEGLIIQDYSSRAPGTLTLAKDTKVNVLKYEGDWAMVETNNGHTGYVSRYFIRPLN